MIEKEPITVVISDKGWIRGIEGASGRICLAAVQGWRCTQGWPFPALPPTQDRHRHHRRQGLYAGAPTSCRAARGHGEPLRIIVGMDNDQAGADCPCAHDRRASC